MATGGLATKVIYYDPATSTQALYGCLDAFTGDKILDYLSNNGIIGPNWSYKVILKSIIWLNYIEGVLVISSGSTITSSMTTQIKNLLWTQAGYWLPTDALFINKSKC